MDDFNQAFFDKIDEIDNKISKDIDFKTIINELNLKLTIKNDYINLDNKKTIENKIYNYRSTEIDILEDKNTYIFYKIDKINTKIPTFEDEKFKLQIKDLLFQKDKFDFNKKIIDQISKGEFNQTDFTKFATSESKKITINSIEDNKDFETNSIEILYSLPVNAYTLIADDKNNIYLAKTINYVEKNISQNSNEFKGISNEASAQNRNGILKSFDYVLNDKYKVTINDKTLERVKNYFR